MEFSVSISSAARSGDGEAGFAVYIQQQVQVSSGGHFGESAGRKGKQG